MGDLVPVEAAVEGTVLEVVEPTIPEEELAFVRRWICSKRSAHTRRAYAADARDFLAFVQRPLQDLTHEDVQDYAADLERRGLAPRTRTRRLSAIRALLTKAAARGHIAQDVGGDVAMPMLEDVLAERIIPEEAALRLIHLEPHPRDHALLRLLYGAGLRVSEACQLAWRHLKPHPTLPGHGTISVHGKGGKPRTVLLSAGTWRVLLALRGAAGDEDPMFRSRKGGGHLDPATVRRIVKRAAARVGLSEALSPHWLRHAHASHALDNQAPIHLVKETLGHASIATTGKYLHVRPNNSSALALKV
ncbi:tyrosine-type recombinase/integrase [Azospirillum sp. SYSU D00513]|uniref:tyrosine-type recombinase/integrase n=1 Tax=Azospirillum sp. SYSU D00513 TaxID=2812561 RepID=UPI001A95C760|nr:tyrosine-type recombinase/integrase [Azospirillum sp. SYSU D00513]